MLYDYKQTTWMNPNISYLFDDEIVEWDIKDAGFSLIKEFKLLPTEEINRLSKMEKGIGRHIEIGKMQKNDLEFSNRLLNAFADARKFFMQMNNITDDDIISVKKDAFFITKKPNRVNFGQIHFVAKNSYSSYLRFPNIHNIEIYYMPDGNMDFKQISDSCVDRHRLYTVEFLKGFIKRMENHDNSVKRYIMKYITEYKFLQMDEEYYLEFNNKSRDVNPLFNYREVLIPLLSVIIKEVA